MHYNFGYITKERIVWFSIIGYYEGIKQPNKKERNNDNIKQK